MVEVHLVQVDAVVGLWQGEELPAYVREGDG